MLWDDEDPRVTIQVSNGMQTLSNGEVLLPVTEALWPKRQGVDPNEKRPHVIYEGGWQSPEYRREVRLLRSTDHGQTWSLETPPWNLRTQRFYEKAGYVRVGRTSSGDLLYEKRVSIRTIV